MEIDLPGQLAHEMVGYEVTAESPVLNRAAVPMWARPVFVVRRNKILDPATAGDLSEGDYAYFLVPPDRVPILDRVFAGDEAPDRGVLLMPIRGSVSLGVIADLYGAEVAEEDRDLTVSEQFDRTFETTPSLGDRLTLGPVTLVARVLEGDEVSEAAIVLSETGDGGGSAGGADAETGLAARWRQTGRRLAGRLRPWVERARP